MTNPTPEELLQSLNKDAPSIEGATDTNTDTTVNPSSSTLPVPLKTIPNFYQSHDPRFQATTKSPIRWVDGIPVPAYGQALSKAQITDLLQVAASLPYEGDPDPDDPTVINPPDPRFLGMTNIEVAIVREIEKAAGGQSNALHSILDRILGKPKQATENVNMSMSLNEYLEQKARENGTEPTG